MPSPSRGGARLKVLIHSASNLPRGDEKGLSDPYVVGFLDESSEALFETQVCRQTLDPVWDEEHTVPYIAGHGLLLQVMDKDDTMKDIAERLMSFRGMGSDFLAEARLATEDFYPHGFEGEVMLEGLPEGRIAFLRLEIVVEGPQPQAFVPPPHAAQHEPEVNEKFDSRDLEPAEEAVPKPRPQVSFPVEQRGGSSPSRPAQVPCDLSILVLSARGLGTASRPCYASCEVKGSFFSKTAVVDVEKPVWRKKMDFEYDGLQPVLFHVYRKEVWPSQDTLLGTAVLEEPSKCTEVDLPLDGLEGACLRLEVASKEKRRVARREHPHQRYLEQPATRKEPISHATKTAAHPGDVPRRLRVLIQSFRGLHGLELATRRCFSCICAVAGRRHADLQTGTAFEAGYQTVWNLEGEIRDYVDGEDLEFHVACEGSTLEGSATLRCHQFYPFGFNSDLTISNDGQGILGLLRVKVSVEKDQTASRITSRSLGLDPQGELYLRSLRPSDAREKSLQAATTDRHRLNQSSESVIRRASPRSPKQAVLSRPSSPQSVATRISGSPPRAVAVHPSFVGPPVVAYTQVTHPVTQVVTYPPVVSHQQVNYPVVSHSQVSYAPMVTQQPVSYAPVGSPRQVSYAPVMSQSMPRPSYSGAQPLTTSVQSLGSFTPPLPMWTQSSAGAGQTGTAGAWSLLEEARASLRAGRPVF